MQDVKQIIDNVKKLGTEQDQHKDGTGKKKAAFAGAIIGFTAGLMIGYVKSWNLFYSAIGGAIAGGIIASVVVPKD